MPIFDPGLLKTLIGSFAGASLAFASNIWFQHRERNRKNKAAGNLALATLGRQWNDFVILKKGFEDTRNLALRNAPTIPQWGQAKPVHFYFSEGLKFNYESLTFLFESSYADVYQKLTLSEASYYDLSTLTHITTEALEQVQKKLAMSGVTSGSTLSVPKAETAIGPDLVAKANSLVDGLSARFANDGERYTTAITALQGALVKQFGKKHVIKVEVN